MTFEEQVDLVRNLKGAAASILWILLLSGRSLTNKELQQATRYSDKSVKDGLDWLEPRGFVQFNGRVNGYSLGMTTRQLPIPAFLLTAAPDGVSASSGLPVSRELPEELSTGKENGVLEIGKIPISSDEGEGEIGKFPISAGNGSDKRSEKFRSPAAGEGNRSENFRSPNGNGARDRKNSDLRSENFRSPAEFRDSYLSVDLSVVVNDQDIKNNKQTDSAATDRKISDLRRVVRLLRLRNPARKRVLDRGDDPAVVLAWWWIALCEEGWLKNHAGWIVKRLDEAARQPETADEPDDGYVELARCYLALDEGQREELEAIEYAGELQRFWEARGVSDGAAALVFRVDEAGGFQWTK